jgi:hypothetical protein
LPWFSYWEGKKNIQVPRLTLLIGVRVWFIDEYGQDSNYDHPLWRLSANFSPEPIFHIGPMSSWNMGIYRMHKIEVFAAAFDKAESRSDDENDSTNPMRPVVV